MKTIQRLLAVAVLLAIAAPAAQAQCCLLPGGTATLSTVGPGTKAGYLNITGKNTANAGSTWKSSTVSIWITGGTGELTLDSSSIGATGNFNVDVGAGLLTSGQTYWVVIQTVFTKCGQMKTIQSDPIKGTAK